VDLDLNCVASYLVLLEERHFGRAAVELHLTSTALGKRLQRLERQLGVTLIERGPAGFVGVTSAGYRFARAAKPLLEQARAAADTARARSSRDFVRVAVPCEIGSYPTRAQLAAAGRMLRESHPETRLICRGVPFPALVSQLLHRQVDVTYAPALHHPGIWLTPLADRERVGIVSMRHELAQTTEVDVSDFAALPMLYSPAIPGDWMQQFYLGDVRPASEARLVAIDARNSDAMIRQLIRGTAVTTIMGGLVPSIGPPVHVVRLKGVPPAIYYAAQRRSDRREKVQALVRALERASALV